jgi:hypothetical protein
MNQTLFSPNQAIRSECRTEVTVLVAHPVTVGHGILPGGGRSTFTSSIMRRAPAGLLGSWSSIRSNKLNEFQVPCFILSTILWKDCFYGSSPSALCGEMRYLVDGIELDPAQALANRPISRPDMPGATKCGNRCPYGRKG